MAKKNDKCHLFTDLSLLLEIHFDNNMIVIGFVDNICVK